MFAPEDVEMNSQGVYGSVSEKTARKNGVEKIQGVVVVIPLVIRGLITVHMDAASLIYRL